MFTWEMTSPCTVTYWPMRYLMDILHWWPCCPCQSPWWHGTWLGWWTCWQKKMDNWMLLINLSTACHFSQNDWRLIESKERKEERHFCWNKQLLHKLGGIMLPKKSIISPYSRLSRNQIAIYLHLSDLGRGKPFFCHCISGVGEPLVVGIRKRNRGAHSRLSLLWMIAITAIHYQHRDHLQANQGPKK